MGQPVKISTELLTDARQIAEVARRSIAGQIEFWARLGRAIEPALLGAQALALARAGGARPLSECLASVETEDGRRALGAVLASLPFPHYEPASDEPGAVIRIEADGTRQQGRVVGRRFVVTE